jgi:uncharacterized protein
LIVKLSDIEDRLIVKGEIASPVFENLEEEQFTIESPVRFELVITKLDDSVRISGPVRSTVIMSCSRCLEEFSCPLETYLDIEVEPKRLLSHEAEVELRPDDLDIYYYDGDEINLDPLIYDEVLLNLPIRPLCREDCAGLCHICGKNKNVESCACSQYASTVLGEKLKNFLNT